MPGPRQDSRGGSLAGLGLGPPIWVLTAPPCTPVLTRPLSAGVSAHVCNEHRYGYMNVPVKSHQGLEDERVNFIHLILEALGEGCEPVCPPSPPLGLKPLPNSFPDSGQVPFPPGPQSAHPYNGGRWIL